MKAIIVIDDSDPHKLAVGLKFDSELPEVIAKSKAATAGEFMINALALAERFKVKVTESESLISRVFLPPRREP